MFRKKKLYNESIEFEKHVANHLKAQGFKHVIFTPKTGDYGADILCFDIYGTSCAIQCKYYSKAIGYEAVQEALAGARYYKCQRALVIGNTRFTKNAIKGAKEIGVELFICHK